MKPKITIVTSSYWRPDLLHRTIQSVQNQTFQDYEHIVVSDHDPFTEYVCNDFKDDDRIRFIEVQKPYEYNLGSVSFNVGLDNAKSDYFCYVLDDDILCENHLKEHYNHLRKGNAIGHSEFKQINFNEPNNTAKFIASTSLETLQNMNTHNINCRDVSRLSHTVEIGKTNKWKTQTELDCGWEDNVFMEGIGLGQHHFINEVTTIKCQWGGISRSKETKGVDKEYYDALMSKVVKDNNTFSGYRLESDTPYVYPELKNSLFGES